MSTPSRWVQLTDPQTENPFFANMDTGVCVWELPAHIPVLPESAESKRGDEWWELLDENSGRVYYFNFPKRHTDWARPTHGSVLPLTKVKLSEIAATIDEDGNVVHLDDDPEDGPPPVEELELSELNLHHATAAEQPLPEGWHEQVDPATQVTFYVNMVTLQSQWDRPTSAAKAPDATPAPTPASSAVTAVKKEAPAKLEKKPKPTTTTTTPTTTTTTTSYPNLSNGDPPLTTASSQPSTGATTPELEQPKQLKAHVFQADQIMAAVNHGHAKAAQQRSVETGRAKVETRSAHTEVDVDQAKREADVLSPPPVRVMMNAATVLPAPVMTTAVPVHINAAQSYPITTAPARPTATPAQPPPAYPSSDSPPTGRSAPPAKTLNPFRAAATDSMFQNRLNATDLIDLQTDPNSHQGNRNIGIPVMNNQAAWEMSMLNPETAKNHEKTEADKLKDYAATQSPRDVTGANVRPGLPPSLKDAIANFQMAGYAKKYFAVHKRGLFRRKIPLNEMMVWTADLIPGPLLGHHGQLYETKATYAAKDAVSIFKAIQTVMGDRVSKNRLSPSKITQTILEKGLFMPEIRDEIFVQVVKQITQNPNEDSRRRGWTLMAVIVTVFPPSRNFEGYLHSFFAEHHNSPVLEVATVSRYASKKLAKICAQGAGARVPTIPEIDRSRDLPFNPSVFGSTLTDIMEMSDEPGPLPRVLTALAESVIASGGEKTEGIFRVPGDTDGVCSLKLRIEKGDYDFVGINDPHQPGSLLKLWLRELEEPLIPANLYDECIKIAAKPGALEILDRLPVMNRRVCDYLIAFLQRIGRPENRIVTKMSIDNLAMVFAPSFLRCPSDNPQVLFENTKYEQDFTRNLLLSKPVVDLSTFTH